MPANDRELDRCEGAGLEQNRVGHPELADVVQWRCVTDQLRERRIEAQALREQRSGAPDALRVLVRLVVAILGGEREAAKRLPAGVLELRRPASNGFLE